MASVKAAVDADQIDITIQWDFSSIVEAVGRLQAASLRDGNGLKVIGRRIDEISLPLADALRQYSPVLIQDFRDLQHHIGGNIRHIPDIDRLLQVLFKQIPDWSLDRYNVHSKNGDLWSFGYDKISENIFKSDSTYFSNASALRELGVAVSETFSNKVVIFGKNSTGSKYINAIFPKIVRDSVGSTWIFLDRGDQFGEIIMPKIDRDYVSGADMVELLAGVLNSNFPTVRSFVSKHKKYNQVYSGLDARLTGSELRESVKYYYELAISRGIEQLPEVPAPRSAPLQFVVSGTALKLADDVALVSTKREILVDSLKELRELADDATEHHNLSNVAPVLNKKVKRLSHRVVEMLDIEITESRVISLGMLVDALSESLEVEKEDLIASAEGAIRGLVTQSQIFVNRFEARRRYLRDAYLSEESASVQDAAIAVEVLKVTSKTPNAMDQSSVAEVGALISEAEEGNLPAERAGLLASVQNLAAVAAAFAKESVVKAGRFAAETARGSAGRAVMTVGAGGIILALLSAEPTIAALAANHPHLLGWTADFFAWLKSSVEVLRLHGGR